MRALRRFTLLGACGLAALACQAPLALPDVLGGSSFGARGAIRGEVWIDADGDGVREGGEAAGANVGVSLFGEDGVFLEMTTTDESGRYRFDDLPQGSYVIEVERPAGYALTLRDEGDDEALDSDVHRTTGRSAPIMPAADLSLNAGLISQAAAAPSPTPLPPAPTEVESGRTPEPVGTPVRAESVEGFIEAFAAALERGDVDFLFDRLHPVVLELKDAGVCRAYIEQEFLQIRDYRLVGSVEGPFPRTFSGAGESYDVPELYEAEVAFLFQGQAFEATAALAPVEGAMHWFTECE